MKIGQTVRPVQVRKTVKEQRGEVKIDTDTYMYPCQVWCWSVQGFSIYEGLKIGVFHWQGESPLQQFCTTVQTVITALNQRVSAVWRCIGLQTYHEEVVTVLVYVITLNKLFTLTRVSVAKLCSLMLVKGRWQSVAWMVSVGLVCPRLWHQYCLN